MVKHHANWKRAFAFMLSLVLIFSNLTVASAAETATNSTDHVLVSHDEDIMTLSSNTVSGSAISIKTDDESQEQQSKDSEKISDATKELAVIEGAAEEPETEMAVLWTEESPGAQLVEIPKQDEVEESQAQVRAAAESPVITYQQAYDRLYALRNEAAYSEGTVWTDDEPYGTGKNAKKEYYTWNGGLIGGVQIVTVGCAGFAFDASDKIFGDLPNRSYTRGNFTIADVHPGDILRLGPTYVKGKLVRHVVIVLKVSPEAVIVAEGNYNGTVHWGRAIPKSDVENADRFITRYPAGYKEIEKAEEVTVSGQEGGLSWSLMDNGHLVISGSGAIPNYTSTTPSWETYKANISTVTIGDGVTNIGSRAFYGYENLYSVYIPESVTTIGSEAFSATGLISTTIPSNVREIGSKAFKGCDNLISLSIDEGLTTIGSEAFRACMSLRYADFPASITDIGYAAFMSCNALVSIRFKPSTSDVNVGDSAFAQCQYLVSVTLPQKLTRISNYMFQSCTSLCYLYIPGTVTDIGENPFTSTGFFYYGQIDYGGSVNTWKNSGGQFVLNTFQKPLSTKDLVINYDVPFDDPFDVPVGGDMITIDGEDPTVPTDPVEPTDPTEHSHVWADDWTNDSEYHWHECVNTVTSCAIVVNSEKAGYGQHEYTDWIVDTAATETQEGSQHRDCTICGYRETATVPATGETTGSDDNGEQSNPDDPSNPNGSDNTGSSGTNTGADNSGNSSETGGNTSSGTSSGNGSNSGNAGTSSGSNSGTSGGSGSASGSGSSSGSGGSGAGGSSSSNGTGTSSNPGSTTNPDSTENNPSGTNPNDPTATTTPGVTDNPNVDNPGNTTPSGDTNSTGNGEQKQEEKPASTKKPTSTKKVVSKMKKQLKKELTPQLKKQLTKKLKQQIKAKKGKMSKAKLKAKLNKQFKTSLKKSLKVKLKKSMKKQFGKSLDKTFTKQFDKAYNEVYNQQYKSQFATLFKKLYK